jgi:hypothetical protein
VTAVTVTPGDPYIQAVQKANVDVHFTSVTRLTRDGVIGGDGIERKVDTMICAIGIFSDSQYQNQYPLTIPQGFDIAYS